MNIAGYKLKFIATVVLVMGDIQYKISYSICPKGYSQMGVSL